ncbi:hypothetical protein [Bradyrhizobium erythrophlei]|uniref:Uncharacterized protein n=1 Tax=Bradyrhizobium erythrophlei TaxID=1437360 RepID=A0A1M5R3C0_9BRAD|nr:hypothetical protein [Bradyrhizobium erythrophlei]SHH20874.1 hypothetical protein SAMN05444169_6323 [Bradyrhizobium erythrophlei]
MLTEPDMQARYVAATLGVIKDELQNPDSPANRRALSTLIASASRAAATLAEDLRRAGAMVGSVNQPAAPQPRGNVLAFRRV